MWNGMLNNVDWSEKMQAKTSNLKVIDEEWNFPDLVHHKSI